MYDPVVYSAVYIPYRYRPVRNFASPVSFFAVCVTVKMDFSPGACFSRKREIARESVLQKKLEKSRMNTRGEEERLS